MTEADEGGLFNLQALGSYYLITESDRQTLVEEVRFLNLIRIRATELLEELCKDEGVSYEVVENLQAALAGRALQ